MYFQLKVLNKKMFNKYALGKPSEERYAKEKRERVDTSKRGAYRRNAEEWRKFCSDLPWRKH
jgi:hypothetical protein